jgi:1-acyl-sn-glycerol-3-phosphate acyltransferase
VSGMDALRGVWRLFHALLHVMRGWFTVAIVFPRLNPAQRAARVQVWALQMLEVLGIGVQVRGRPPVLGPLLLVANHISWLDILVMHAARHCRFVAKSDVRRWPLIGTLASGGGTLYIERESRRDAMRVVHQMARALKDGDILAVFPEGTTSDGQELLPFHSNLIQAAVATDTPVQPVALQFVDAASGSISLTPCYVGDDTLLGSVWRTVTGPRVNALVAYGLPQAAAGRSRRAWAADLRNEVRQLRAAAVQETDAASRPDARKARP